jgi:hypothetical protein
VHRRHAARKGCSVVGSNFSDTLGHAEAAVPTAVAILAALGETEESTKLEDQNQNDTTSSEED